jgi:hypothetical protein
MTIDIPTPVAIGLLAIASTQLGYQPPPEIDPSSYGFSNEDPNAPQPKGWERGPNNEMIPVY